MRRLAFVLIGVAALGAPPARSGDAPAIVIPGKAGVPVVINGIDASYCVVEGDYGLDRPGHVPTTIVACPWLAPSVGGYDRGYFPAGGRQPGYGRFERVPSANRQKAAPAQEYYREWGTQSDMIPATVDPPPNLEINVAPSMGGPRRRYPRRR
jgi:hypothetical protein